MVIASPLNRSETRTPYSIVSVTKARVAKLPLDDTLAYKVFANANTTDP